MNFEGEATKMMERPFYIKKLLDNMKYTEIKILTGVRGVGKSYILNLFYQKLIENGISSDNIIRIDLDSIEHCFISYTMTLYEFISDKIINTDRTFILIDEVQKIPNWYEPLAELKSNFNVDIYISSSGPNIIDNKCCEKLKHRPIEIEILPPSFREYQSFFKPESPEELNNLFDSYLYLGSMPILLEHKKTEYLKDIFYSTAAQDIFAVNKIAESNMILLLAKVLFVEIGNVHSFSSLSKILAEITGKALAVRTVENYVNMLVAAKLFYAVPVFDAKNNYSLTRYVKYYPVDLGFYSVIMGNHNIHDVHILESVVYFELLRFGVKVSTCKVGNKRVAFLAESTDNKMYIHVTNSLNDTQNNQNSKDIFAPLRSINDHYSKWILTLDRIYSHSEDGIRVSNIVDFLIDE